jgi:hypothetical protein
MDIPAGPFFMFVGFGKILSVLGMWLAAGPLRTFFKFTVMLPPGCGGYMHYALQDGKTAPAAVITLIAFLLLVLPEPTAKKVAAPAAKAAAKKN